MADRTEGSTDIAATPAEVMAVITDYEAYPEWATGVKVARILERDGKGRATSVAFEISQSGVGAKYTLAYTYAGRGRRLSWTTVEASGVVKDVEGEYVLESADGGTRVTYRTTVDLAIPMMGFMKRQAEKMIISTALDGLKARVERS
jgi:carbon monoxide dehydrogenase subunit G